jgi:integrase
MAKISRFHKAHCPGGKCDCPYRLDFRPQGVHGQRKRIEFPTKKAAEKYLAATSTKVARNEYIEPAKVPTFKEAAEVWFASKTDRRPSHVADLRSRLDKHILPRMGTERLDRIKVGDIEKLRNDLRGDSYAPRTVNTIIRIVAAVFRAAKKRHEVPSNPVDDIEAPFKAARELRSDEDTYSNNDDAISPDAVLAPHEIRAMLGATEPGLYRALFTTAALTGARSGELFALRWSDIEMPRAIYIRRTVSWAHVKGEPIRPRYYPPKTKAGFRKIPIASELAAILRVWKLQCPPTQDEFVFPASNGQPMRRSNALRYGLWPALRRAGLRRVNMHSLRHSFASALIMGGAPVTEVQSLLGHASAAITLRVYTHWFKTVDSGAVARLSQVILRNVDTVSESAEERAKSGHANACVPSAKSLSA